MTAVMVDVAVEWTPALVKALLAEAAETLTRMPGKGTWPSRSVTMQIDVVRDFWEAYGRQPANVRKGLASPQQIAHMDEALSWLLWLEAKSRRLVWARAMGVTWRDLQDRMDRSMRALQYDYEAAIGVIARRLNAA